jgi:hypothetical protein
VSDEEKTVDVSNKGTLLSLYSHKESNIAFAVFIALVLLLGSIQSLDWNNNYYQQAVDAKTADDWSIRFDITTSSQQHTEVWQDKETKIIEFEMEDFGIPEGDFIGAVFVNITPKDSDASAVDPLVQCDAISADIEKNQYTAQWDYEGNNLSGQDSSCETILMYLQVYPGYTGSEQASDAPNEYQALMPWTISGWGEGVLEIKVELDVNSVDQLGPVSQDEDEEITITVNIETFTAEAVMNT